MARSPFSSPPDGRSDYLVLTDALNASDEADSEDCGFAVVDRAAYYK
ncbi:hypothetical protein [Promineifilum sp.]